MAWRSELVKEVRLLEWLLEQNLMGHLQISVYRSLSNEVFANLAFEEWYVGIATLLSMI